MQRIVGWSDFGPSAQACNEKTSVTIARSSIAGASILESNLWQNRGRKYVAIVPRMGREVEAEAAE